MNSIENNILDISNNYYKYLLNLENVNAVGLGYKKINGIDTKEPCIHVLVNDKVNEKFLSKNNIIPKNYMGIKTDVIKTGKVRPKMDVVIKERIRPLEGGVSIHSNYINGPGFNIGTLGCIVTKVVNGEREFFILSNNHVLASTNKTDIGTPIIQPAQFLGGDLEEDVIAHLYDFVKLYPLYRGIGPENYVDCAIGKIVDKSIISNLLYGGRPLLGTSSVNLNDTVKKIGFTTGLTFGKVTTIGLTIETEFEENKVFLFKNQILAELLNSLGDSGSIVTDFTFKAIGLLYAGSYDDKFAYINNIKDVLDKLNVKIYTG